MKPIHYSPTERIALNTIPFCASTVERILCFSIKSSHLDNGYPANIEIKVSYILNDNELLIKYFATTDRLTY